MMPASACNQVGDRRASLETFYAQLDLAFEQACRELPTIQHDLVLAGRTLRLSFAGNAMLANVLPAFQHLLNDTPSAPALQIRIFDSASTGVSLPPTPWSEDAQVARGEIVGLDTDGAIRATLQPGSRVLTLYHPDRATALVWMPDAQSCPGWEAAAPLRGLMHWWCSGHAQQLVHAAAVGWGDGALLLTGKGGSGKSTTALTALAAGMHYVGDDYVICERMPNGARVHSLYNTAKVDDHGLALLPALAGVVDRAPDEALDKSVLYLARSFPAQVCRTLPLRAIVVPRVTTGAARLAALEPGAAFLALAPTTLFQLPGAGQQATGFLRELVTSLPCLQLDLSPDPDQNTRLLKDALAGGHRQGEY